MTVWLKYTDAAARFGISSEAVRQLAIRHRWPRRRPNDDPFGRVEVGVPDEFEPRPRTAVEHPDEHVSDDIDGIDLLRTALDTLRTALERAEQRAGAAEARADRSDATLADERARADALRAQIDALKGELLMATAVQRDLDAAMADAVSMRDRLDELERDRAAAVAIADEAVRAAEDLRRVEDARKARGVLARLRAAWRGR